MTNVVSQKSLKCFQWLVQTRESGNKHISKSFSFQDQLCYFELSLGTFIAFSGTYNTSYLYFKSKGELKFPVTFIVRATSASDALSTPILSKCDIGNADKTIWSYSSNKLNHSLLTFEVIILADPTTKENNSSDLQLPDSKFCLESLSQDFGRMLHDGQAHDVELKCEDRSWKVHKNVLSVRSRVLETMLGSDMVEGRTGVITIRDMDVPTVQHFLEYLYSGKLPEMNVETAKRFYEIGDKYVIECLKKSCSNYLVNILSPETVCEILIIADQHSDSSFKERIIDYIIGEKIVLNDSIWRDFSKNHPMIAIDVYYQFCKYYCSK